MVQIHVTPYLFGWQIKVNGKRVSRFSSKQSTVDCARFLARLMAPTTLKVHGRKGKIQEELTFTRSDDPPQTPG